MLSTAWKVKLAAKALALGLLAIGAMAVLFYSAAERFQGWPV